MGGGAWSLEQGILFESTLSNYVWHCMWLCTFWDYCTVQYKARVHHSTMQLYRGTPAFQGKIMLQYNATLSWDSCNTGQDYTTVQCDFIVGLLPYKARLCYSTMQLYCGTPAIQGKITLLYNVTLLWDFCSARQDYTTVQYDFTAGLLHYSRTLLWDSRITVWLYCETPALQ